MEYLICDSEGLKQKLLQFSWIYISQKQVRNSGRCSWSYCHGADEISSIADIHGELFHGSTIIIFLWLLVLVGSTYDLGRNKITFRISTGTYLRYFHASVYKVLLVLNKGMRRNNFFFKYSLLHEKPPGGCISSSRKSPSFLDKTNYSFTHFVYYILNNQCFECFYKWNRGPPCSL